jgi:hypothetical protein
MLKLLKRFKPTLAWLDDHILEYLSFALIIVIPLFPKIPLADLIPGYIVRLRLDDVLVALTFGIWFIWLLRGKVNVRHNVLLIPILVYLGIGLASSLSAIFITKTVPLSFIHISKLFLHFFRRVEYFSLFFIFFSTIRNLDQVKKYIYVIALVLMGVSIYGFGQKYLYWPAYSTMNREFSKGITLYLTEHARVLSTFGGHYDLAAYMMMLLTLFVPLVFIVKKWSQRVFFFLVAASGFWILILTVSRTSFIAYLVAITIAFGLLIKKKGYLWSISRWVLVILVSLVVMLSFGDLSERFSHVLKLDGLKNMLALKPFAKPPSGSNVAFTGEPGTQSDIPPTTEKPTPAPGGSGPVPSDVFTNVPENGASTEGLPASLAAKPRTYSPAALNYDLSTGIRLDYTWPKAIEGFKKNILLGSGYSTLTKINVETFTEAESTDNDFLRALGETGLLGFLAFFGLIGLIIYKGIKSLNKISDPFYYTIVASLVAATFGLLINAVYIDVFEASKVVYTFWMLAAILLAIVELSNKKAVKK